MNLAASRTPSNASMLGPGDEDHKGGGRMRRDQEESLDSDVKDYFAKSRSCSLPTWLGWLWLLGGCGLLVFFCFMFSCA